MISSVLLGDSAMTFISCPLCNWAWTQQLIHIHISSDSFELVSWMVLRFPVLILKFLFPWISPGFPFQIIRVFQQVLTYQEMGKQSLRIQQQLAFRSTLNTWRAGAILALCLRYVNSHLIEIQIEFHFCNLKSKFNPTLFPIITCLLNKNVRVPSWLS